MFIPTDHIQTTLKNLPHKPGCYLMKDKNGLVIYVGKAINLHSRVRSYFDNTVSHPRTLALRGQIADIEFIVLPDEVSALHTEYNLIKKYRPHYNIRLKDDKRYPYIAVRLAQPFPKVEITRNMVKDGTRYFGPYTAAWSVRETLDTIRKAFPYLTCDRDITGKDERACLYYDIKMCNAPCIGVVNQAEYRAGIDQLMEFLSGRSDKIIRDLKASMIEASEALDFEQAATLRDRLDAMQRVVEKQKIVGGIETDQDVIAFSRIKDDTCVQVLFIRSGRLVGREYFMLENADQASESEILSTFVTQFYEEAAEMPDELLLPHELDEALIISAWLRDKRGGTKVKLTVPQKGDKAELVRIAEENATETLQMLRAQWEADTNKQTLALSEIQAALKLPAPPNRIECFDISTLQGTATVASRVVFVQGTAKKAEYRKFNIRTVQTVLEPNDFASMREALTRRFQRHADAMASINDPIAPGKKDDNETWRLLPDLLIIDGGKGQLGIAVEVLRAFGLFEQVPVVGLAKQFEELYQPGHPSPVLLPRRSEGLYLVQRIRDEAHRFAITANRNQRAKKGLVSRLEEIPGIGPAKRKALLKAFNNDIDQLKAASVEQLVAVSGITVRLAELIKTGL